MAGVFQQALAKQRAKVEAAEALAGPAPPISAKKLPPWVLYYSDEGYPYYYNHDTGESEWAEVEVDSTSNSAYEAAMSKARQSDDSEEETESDNSDSEADSSSSNSDNEIETEEDLEAAMEVLKDATKEQQFRAFLRTPEGMRVAQEEEARVAEKFRANQLRQQKKVEERLRKKMQNNHRSYPLGWGAIAAIEKWILGKWPSGGADLFDEKKKKVEDIEAGREKRKKHTKESKSKVKEESESSSESSSDESDTETPEQERRSVLETEGQPTSAREPVQSLYPSQNNPPQETINAPEDAGWKTTDTKASKKKKKSRAEQKVVQQQSAVAAVSLAAVVNVWDKLKQSLSSIVYRATDSDCTRPLAALTTSSSSSKLAALSGLLGSAPSTSSIVAQVPRPIADAGDVEAGEAEDSTDIEQVNPASTTTVQSAAAVTPAMIVDLATSATKVGWSKLTAWSREGLSKVLDVTGSSVANVSQSLWTRLNDTMLAIVESDMKAQEEAREEQRKQREIARAQAAATAASSAVDTAPPSPVKDASIPTVGTPSPRLPSSASPRLPTGLPPRHPDRVGASPRQPDPSPRQRAEMSPRILIGSVPAMNLAASTDTETPNELVAPCIAAIAESASELDQDAQKVVNSAIDVDVANNSAANLTENAANPELVEIRLDGASYLEVVSQSQDDQPASSSTSKGNECVEAPIVTQPKGANKGGGDKGDKKKKKTTKKK